MKITEILSYHKYYCIAGMIAAMRDNKFEYLLKMFTAQETIKILKNIDEYIAIINGKDFVLHHHPLPIFLNNKLIYKNHFQIAAFILAGIKEINVIYKKIGEPILPNYSALDQIDKTDLGRILESIT